MIAGEFKGRRLVTPRGRRTRPTADQVRLALMDTLGPWLPRARVLDLYAGAGGVGLEALSRGAVHATFVERDAQALRALAANVEALGVAGRARVVRRDVARAGLAASDGIVIAQHRTKRPPAAGSGTLVLSRTRKFGETTLTFFRALKAEPPAAI